MIHFWDHYSFNIDKAYTNMKMILIYCDIPQVPFAKLDTTDPILSESHRAV